MFKLGTIAPPPSYYRVQTQPPVEDATPSVSCLTLSNPSGLLCVTGIVQSQPDTLTSLSCWRSVCVNTQSHELLKVDGETVTEIEHKQVLDLSDDGERWEGDVLHNQPYGWGVYYDKDNNTVYEGFRLKDVNVCYGRSYYADSQQLEYCLHQKDETLPKVSKVICEGKRWGRGVQFDRNGKTVFEGEWCDNVHGCPEKERIQCIASNTMITTVESLSIGDNCCNGQEWKALKLDCLSQIKKLIVGNFSFQRVETVVISGLEKLESVTIGSCCFATRKQLDVRNPNACFCFTDCPRVKHLSIGRYSFTNYG
ncbi:hypothetical protein BLSTO_04559 [Blastocystis sp. subtype 1]